MNTPSDRLRGGLVGFGFIMGQGHAPAYQKRAASHQDVEIVAIADVCEARRAAAREAFPGARVYDHHTALLDAEAQRLDFVDIAAPPSEHAPIALDALDAGCHVLCEKPLATSSELAWAMLDRARLRGRTLFPCHNYRHAPVVKAVRAAIDSGAIGRVHLVTLQTFRNTHARGTEEWRPDWRRERRLSGGGIAMDHGSHTFYLACDWMGACPEAITARTVTAGPYDTEDDISCSLRFPGGIATAHLTWAAGFRTVLYSIHGDRGGILVEDDRFEVSSIRDSAHRSYRAEWEVSRFEVPSAWMDSSHVTWFASLFEDFRQAIQRGDEGGQEAEQACRCVNLIESAYASAAAGSRELPLDGRAAGVPQPARARGPVSLRIVRRDRP
jgi:predicted dehydrogenase